MQHPGARPDNPDHARVLDDVQRVAEPYGYDSVAYGIEESPALIDLIGKNEDPAALGVRTRTDLILSNGIRTLPIDPKTAAEEYDNITLEYVPYVHALVAFRGLGERRYFALWSPGMESIHIGEPESIEECPLQIVIAPGHRLESYILDELAPKHHLAVLHSENGVLRWTMRGSNDPCIFVPKNWIVNNLPTVEEFFEHLNDYDASPTP